MDAIFNGIKGIIAYLTHNTLMIVDSLVWFTLVMLGAVYYFMSEKQKENHKDKMKTGAMWALGIGIALPMLPHIISWVKSFFH